MTMEEVISRHREHYVAQFKNYVALLQQNYPEGKPEVKMQIDQAEAPQFKHAPPFDNWFCVDFVSKRGGEMAMRVYSPNQTLETAPVQAKIAEMSVAIGTLRWDNVAMRFAPAKLNERALRQWFNTWFDPENARRPQGAQLSEAIHFVSISDGALKIDFGTAPAEAFWKLLDVLKTSGATSVSIAQGDPI